MPESDDRRSPLTSRERQVLERAARGMSNREIGDDLRIAEQTVKNHLSGAMRKMELHDRTHAVVLAITNGWIALPIQTEDAPEGPTAATAAHNGRSTRDGGPPVDD